jgi:hypothetical protein
MDQDTLVIFKLDAGRRLIDSLIERGLDIRAAFWARPSEERWRLFLACPIVDEKGALSAYSLINSALRDSPELGLEPFDVSAIGVEDSMAQAAMAHVAPMRAGNTNPFGGAVPYEDFRLGRQYVEGAYIYPLGQPGAASTG